MTFKEVHAKNGGAEVLIMDRSTKAVGSVESCKKLKWYN